jgi:GT2 family glycosyltransferase
MSFAVVILSKDSSNLVPCVAAVRENEPGARIIVVDDGLDVRPDGCEYVDGQKPFIYARNANLGILAASSDGVVLLNDDALLKTPGGFSLLERECQLHPEFGIIASTCNNVGNRAQCPRGVGLREEGRTVCFVCVYIPRRTIDAVGLLDERFVKYGLDDDDYSLRVRKAGLKLGIHDGCYVDHGSLKSSYRGEAGAGGDFRPNLRIFIEKWGVDNWGNPRERSQFPECFPVRKAVTQ